MRIKYIILLFSIFFSYQGELVSFELLETFDIEEIQNNLNNDFGETAPDVLYDISMYKIIYNTIDPFGNEVEASGVVAFPENSNQAFPMISWQHGTEVKRDNTSSFNGFNALSFWLTGTGYIYIEPDYLGLGESEILHPYCLKNPSAWTTIDLIRAVETFSFLSNDFESNDDLILFGYSEGGYVTMAAHMMIEDENIDEFNLLASFPMAGPYSLSGSMVDVMLSYEPYDAPFYLPYVLVPYISYYEMGELDEYFLPEYAEIFEYVFDGNYSSSYINSLLPDIPIEVMLPEVIDDFSNNPNYPLRLHLANNDLWNWAPENDVHLFHAIADELIPHNNSQIAYDAFINNGSENVNLYLLPEEYGGHGEAALYCLLAAYQITEDEYKNIRNLGDLNNDFIINIQDILIMIGFILNADELNHLDLWLSDFDSNQIINVQDIILIIDKILRN